MKSIDIISMTPGYNYYINDKVYKTEKKIGCFIGYKLTPNNSGLIAKFINVKKIPDYTSCVDGIHSRHSLWYDFYLPQKNIIEKKIIDELYRKAINKKLQIITGDNNFVWY